ncbi:glycosyltransferase [Robiginitalea sp. SC105]|uniref:glycosyltransferase n=1 Tax=Robiginitalea sp. SC105 TaxID=2762332 RepID=UPI00163A6C6D|nr:glycosyltransferase [Robiginitalea sp. SC105]MBC2840323.1 glycosyltransferase [Robiginitalea sp. SC105]
MKLSIVIPLYNKEKYIGRCLKSLMAQDLPANEYEVVVVDDGSKDAGASIAREFAETHQNIRFFTQKNAGPSAARNKGLDAATGDYVYFLDADDFLAPDVLKGLLQVAEQNKLEILEFNTCEIREGEQADSLKSTKQDPHVQVVDGISYIAEYGFRNEAWRYIIHHGFLKENGIRFIEGTLYEDVIFTASLFLKARRIAKAEMDIHRYVTVADSIVTSRDAAHNLRFIHGMVYAIERIHELIKNMDPSHGKYQKAVEKLKARQQAFVFALLIRTLKYRLLNREELKSILGKMNELKSYPIDPEIGIGHGSAIHNKLFVPMFNNKTVLYTGLSLRRLLPS